MKNPENASTQVAAAEKLGFSGSFVLLKAWIESLMASQYSGVTTHTGSRFHDVEANKQALGIQPAVLRRQEAAQGVVAKEAAQFGRIFKVGTSRSRNGNK